VWRNELRDDPKARHYVDVAAAWLQYAA